MKTRRTAATLEADLDANIRDGLLALDELAAARHPLAEVLRKIIRPRPRRKLPASGTDAGNIQPVRMNP